MTVFVWTTTRDHAIQQFRGDTPGASLEEQIIHHYEKEPQRVIDAIDQIGRSIERGGPNAPVSGWAVLAKNLSSQPTERVVTDDREKQKQLAYAEQWITNAGGYIDRESELVSELYDPDIGRLRHWPDTQAQIIKLWAQQRPRFIAAEAASIERQYEQAQALKRIKAASSTVSLDINPDDHANLIAAAVNVARYGIDPHRDDWVDQLATIHTEEEAEAA